MAVLIFFLGGKPEGGFLGNEIIPSSFFIFYLFTFDLNLILSGLLVLYFCLKGILFLLCIFILSNWIKEKNAQNTCAQTGKGGTERKSKWSYLEKQMRCITGNSLCTHQLATPASLHLLSS